MVSTRGLTGPGRFRCGMLAAGCIVFAGAVPTAAAVEGPSLGGAERFAVLGGASVSNTGGTTVVTGDAGVSPGSSITGFGPGQVTGGTFVGGSAESDLGHADAAIAYAFLAGMAGTPANNLSDLDLGGMTLAPGVYTFNGAAELTGNLTLDAQGSTGALFVFQIGTSLTTAPGSSVTVIRGSKYDRSNIHWQVGSSATIGTTTAFAGNVIADQSVTLNTGASLLGRAIAVNGSVSLDSNAVTRPSASSGGGGKPSQGKGALAPPGGGPDDDASAKVFVKHFPEHRSRDERSWFRVKVRRLDGGTEYSLWCDDPSTLSTAMVQYGTFTTKKRGGLHIKLDTKKGDDMPFGATLADLSGMDFEVRNLAGTTVLLEGTVPTTSP